MCLRCAWVALRAGLPCALLFVAALLVTSAAYAQAGEKAQVKTFSSILLEAPRLPSGAKVREELQKRLGELPAIDGMEDDGKLVILLRVAGGTVMIGLLDRPLPAEELQRSCRAASWYWNDACPTVARHHAHLIVTILGTRLDRIGAALLATRTMAAVMAADRNALGGYWGVNLQPADYFIRISDAARRDKLPVLLWINYRLSRDARGRWSMSTQGMRDFDLMEIECVDAAVDGKELYSMFIGMSGYLIAEGPVIKDGDTIGDSPALGIHVRHVESAWNPGQRVYRIEYPAPKPH